MATTKTPRKKPTGKKLEALKKAQQAYYRKNRKRILAYANNYYAEHKEEVLIKAKARYARKRKDYFCTECGKKFPREMSGHHLYCPKCALIKSKKVSRTKPVAKKAK